ALPAVRLTYPAATGFVPFSEPQQPGDESAAATNRPCRLAVLAAGRVQPVLGDGTAAFPTMALRYAHDLDTSAWPAGAPPREAGHYLTYYEANVPRTARREDLILRGHPGKDVAPAEPEQRQWPVPVPADGVAVLALAGLALLWRCRRKRARAARAS
ncbi:MAG: hypothetical protein HYU66_10600, partial [Armatimonadetes bacterium]|nr:hypothetical protein [Armatimonadota bacterium]